MSFIVSCFQLIHHSYLHSLSWLLNVVTPHQVLHLQAFPLILGRLVLGLQETKFDICENNIKLSQKCKADLIL